MRHNGPWEESWYDRRARENNPLRNGSATIGSDLETSVNDASIGSNYSNNSFMRSAGIGSSLLLAAYMLLITACGGQAAPTPSPTSTAQGAISTPTARQETPTPQPTLEARVKATATPTAVSTQQVVKNGVVIKYNQTDSNGIATFEDSAGGQTVTVQVVDSSSKPLHGMRVQYLDSPNFEGFIVEDPTNRYAPSFRVYPNTTVPPITGSVPPTPLYVPVTMRTSGPKIREVKDPSNEKQGLDNLVEHAKNEWLYLGRRTPKQLDAEDEIYSFIVGLAGVNTSVVSDVAGKIADISDSISSWHEPEFYDVYVVIPTSPITTAIRVLVPVQREPKPAPIVTPPSDKTQIPDGSKVVFESEGKIYLANIPTKEVFHLTPPSQQQSNLEHPDLSPDGKLLVYSSARLLTSRKGIETDNLWLMDIGTGRITKLTTDIAGTPSWSNDGRKIVFFQGMNIYSVNLDKGKCQLKVADTYLIDSNASFSPDDSKILYNRGFTINSRTGSVDRKSGLWIVNSDGSYNLQFFSPEATNPSSNRLLYYFDWSIDGKIAASIQQINESQNQEYAEIVLMDSDGSNIRRIAGSKATGYSGLKWSQDGKYLFFKQATLGPPRTTDLLVIDPKSGDTLDIRTFKWHEIGISPKEVSLGTLLGTEKKPYSYSEECFGPSTEGISTFEMTVGYVKNIRHEDVRYSFDRDREIKLRVMYDNKIAAEYKKAKDAALAMSGIITAASSTAEDYIRNNLTKEVIDRTVIISSKDFSTNRSRIFVDLESELLGSLRKLGVVNVDIRYFEEGLKFLN